MTLRSLPAFATTMTLTVLLGCGGTDDPGTAPVTTAPNLAGNWSGVLPPIQLNDTTVILSDTLRFSLSLQADSSFTFSVDTSSTSLFRTSGTWTGPDNNNLALKATSCSAGPVDLSSDSLCGKPMAVTVQDKDNLKITGTSLQPFLPLLGIDLTSVIAANPAAANLVAFVVIALKRLP